MRRKSSSNNSCMVCESPNAISQFGAMACRACGAFFRRLVVSNRKYQCDCDVRLRGKVESEIARKMRISKCRGCRMKRCFEAGMKKECWTVKNREKSQLIKMENNISIFNDDKDFIFLKKLLDIEEKANHVFLNVIGFPNSFVEHFDSFEELIQSKDNLLAHAELFKNRPIIFFDKKDFEENIAKKGPFFMEPISLTKSLLIAIDIAKMLPVFSRLNLNDQMVAVSHFAQPAGFLIGRFNSLKINAETELMEIIDYPFVKLYTLSNYGEPVINNLAQAIFGLPMKNFLQIAPSREEFVLILALLFSNSAISFLSKHGQGIMNEETEKCAKILLRFQQRQFGDQKGALRYAECLQLDTEI